MILSNLISVETHTSTAEFILYAIFERAEYEKKNTILISQTYLSKLCSTSQKTINRELKYLQEQGYLTYKRALYNNLTTTEITLTDKSIAILNAEAAKPQNKTIKTEETQPQAEDAKASNKPSNKPVKTEPRQPQAETEKTPQTAPKQVETEQADKVHESETEQTEEQAFQTEIEKMNAMYKSLNDIQKGCATALKRAKTDNPVIYVRDAQKQGVPQVLIDFILTYNKMKREEQKYENF